jgi:hypothetical protein
MSRTIPKYSAFGELTLAFVEESSNRKLQAYRSGIKVLTAYIMPTSTDRFEGDWSDYERAVCSLECKHRKELGGSCYVGAAPMSVWSMAKGYRNNHHKDPQIALPRMYGIRATAHGDMCRLNAEGKRYLAEIMQNAAQVRAYTAGWREHDTIEHFQGLAMASVYDDTEALFARGLGWRTYRYRESDNTRAHNGERNCTLLGNGHPSEDGRGCFAACPSPCNGRDFDVVSPDHPKLLRQQQRLSQPSP